MVAGVGRDSLVRAVHRPGLESAENPPADMAYWLMTLRYGELETQAHLVWADEVLALMRETAD